MITVSGFKVFPNEVEEVAMSQGGLLECAVIGVPDRHSGEVPKLFAVKKTPEVTEAEVREFLAANLASYKVPRQIEFRSELPKTNVGKILRRALREESDTPAAYHDRARDQARRHRRVLARGRARSAGSKRTPRSTTRSAGGFWPPMRRPPAASSPNGSKARKARSRC